MSKRDMIVLSHLHAIVERGGVPVIISVPKTKKARFFNLSLMLTKLIIGLFR